MKILSISQGRSVWIFNLAHVAKGRSLLDTLKALGERYRFGKFPQSLTDLNKNNALEFNSGTFIHNGTDYRVGLTVYNNGFSGDSFTDTSISTAFLEDVASWLASEHDVDIKPHIVRIGYLSQLEVQARRSLPLWNPLLEFLQPAISSLATTIDGTPRKYNMEGILAYPEDAGQNMSPSEFRIDRKWGTDPVANVYFSQSPTNTKDHLDLLNKIEDVLLPTS
jgi:hypothetical protein